MTGAGLGWLEGTLRGKGPEYVFELLGDALGAEPEVRGWGTRWYAESASVGPNALVAWSPRKRREAVETHLQVTQTGLDELGGARSLRLVRDLLLVGARFSRVDGYYDDRARHVEPPTVAEAFRQGQAVSHMSRVRELRGWALAAETGGARPDGATTYLGSPKSEALVRVYDKAAESGRADAGVRWEVQMRGDRADLFAAGVVTAGEALGGYVLGCLRSLVDFRDRAGVVHGERAPLIDWWAAIVGDAERVRLNLPVKVDSVEKTAAWLVMAVAPSLALVGIAYGSDWLNALLLGGEKRLTKAQLRLARDRRRARGAR
jgi:hypothetical protein